MASLLDLIPGYRAALTDERLRRDCAFLPVIERVAGFEVVPLALWQWLTLRVIHSPFVLPRLMPPEPRDLEDFLWLLHPDYSPRGGKAQRKFWKRCRRFWPVSVAAFWWRIGFVHKALAEMDAERLANFVQAVGEVQRFVNDALIDGACGGGGANGSASYASDAAYICGLFGREYGWSQAETLNTPMKRIWQFMNETKHIKGNKLSLANPSDQFRADWLRRVNQPKT